MLSYEKMMSKPDFKATSAKAIFVEELYKQLTDQDLNEQIKKRQASQNDNNGGTESKQ